jgi:hypothetical protein
MAPLRRVDRPSASQPSLPPNRALEEFARRIRAGPALSRLDAAAVEAFDAFEAAGVDALLLKGPALARALYAPTEHRGYSDVDVLVAPRHVESTRQILRALGYVNLPEQLGLDEVARDRYAETWARVGARADAGLMFDLHFTLAGAEAPRQVTWDAMRCHHAWIELDGRRLPTLNVEALALHVALHAARHGTADPAPQPIEDLAKALERWNVHVWREADRLARETQSTAAFAAGLRQIPEGVALASDLHLPPTDGLQWAIAHRGDRPRGTLHLQALSRASTLRDRMSVLRRSLLPPGVWIAWQYPWASDHGLRLIAGYTMHLARTPVWAGRAWRFRRRARRARSLP